MFQTDISKMCTANTVSFIVLVAKGKKKGGGGFLERWGLIIEDLQYLFKLREKLFLQHQDNKESRTFQEFNLPLISNAFKMPSESSSECIVKSERSYFFCNKIKYQ